MITDADLEFWGDYFVNHGLRAYGFTFEQFLESPATVLAAASSGVAVTVPRVCSMFDAAARRRYGMRPAMHLAHFKPRE